MKKKSTAPPWLKELQKMLMDWVSERHTHAEVEAKVRVKGYKPMWASASYDPGPGDKKLPTFELARSKIRKQGWEVVFVTYGIKYKEKPFDEGQCAFIFFNGVPIGLVSDLKIIGEPHGLSMSFKVPLFGRAIYELKEPRNEKP